MSIVDGFPGRDLDINWNGTPLLGVREKAVTINGEPIDVTTDDDNGWRKILSIPGQKQVDISVSGITKSHVLKQDVFAGTRTRAVTLTYPNGTVISADFYLSEYVETGTYNDAVTFEATLMSTGVVTLT